MHAFKNCVTLKRFRLCAGFFIHQASLTLLVTVEENWHIWEWWEAPFYMASCGKTWHIVTTRSVWTWGRL